MRRRRRLSYDERAYIDVVPLVDTLLAVFLFLALLAFQSPITFLTVKLPFAKEGEKLTLEVFRVQVFKEGRYEMGGKEVSLQELERLLEEKKPKTLVLEAEEDAPHKFVVELMDLGKRKGVESLLIGVRKRR
ncbi:MAG: biopolymer transporter ExbD [Aquificaceae bacterium]|nr:biopolymer transporter ExbD [Aquificaceae bacterium]MCS7195929.1 biopolymer transporter ExbD [Aquificaceae bacterium]MCX7989094.1 biopolymer transporter ExbD [Aquificaceae bacterium]MDW8032982.1 biopolymer transporter ExbD [Aquificaceae bacterium]MDW8293925.1 biopolymer transporter ExbD [Aquificaceae bacterium]